MGNETPAPTYWIVLYSFSFGGNNGNGSASFTMLSLAAPSPEQRQYFRTLIQEGIKKDACYDGDLNGIIIGFTGIYQLVSQTNYA